MFTNYSVMRQLTLLHSVFALKYSTLVTTLTTVTTPYICYRPVLPFSSSGPHIDQLIQQQGDRRNSLNHCIWENVNFDTWTVIEISEPIF